MQEEKHRPTYKVQGACAKQGARKWHYSNNRNKLSLSLNLKEEKSFPVPLQVEDWVGLSGSLSMEVVRPPEDGRNHSITNRGRRRITSLLRQSITTICGSFD